MYKELFINVLLIFTPIWFCQVFMYDRLFDRRSVPTQIVMGAFCGVASILCMLFPIITGNSGDSPFLWDLRWIPFLLAIFYGGTYGGATAFLLLIGYRLYVGSGSAFVTVLVDAVVFYLLFVPLHNWYHRFNRYQKVLISFAASVMTFSIMLISLRVYLDQENKLDFFQSYGSSLFPFMGICYVLATLVAVLLMENIIDNTRIRVQAKHLVDTSFDTIGIIRDNRWVFLNESGLKMFGATDERLIVGQPVTNLLHPDYHHICKESFTHIASEKQAVCQLEWQWNTFYGELLDTEVQFIPYTFENRSAIQIVIRDISARKQIESELIQREEQYRKLVEESPNIKFIVANGRCLYINQTGVTMLHAGDKSQVIGRPMSDFIHPDFHEVFNRNVQLVKHGLTAEVTEEKLIRMDGEILDVEVRALPTVYHGHPAQLIIVSDITELKKSREILQQSEKLTVVGELAAGIAHEIRNPLTSLRGFVQLFQYQAVSNNEEVYRIMLSEIDRINTIVGELLLLAKPKKMDFEDKNLLFVIEDVLALLQPQAHLLNIQFFTHFQTSSPFIHCAENKLKQVFINILKNGMEAMPDGGEIHIYVEVGQDQVSIRFVDQGCGIPEDRLPKIGQAFFTTKEKGTGLGIMVSYSIIDSHHGQMYFHSQAGTGTTVIVVLPIAVGTTITSPVKQLVEL
ncbi:PAS domain S-box protein [Brevibacillus dissolubilis]|uniref:PAS domain S-box protein n=1 Tax=Brevibacillus dissolubilis TaxID=1844116 RepID=UPI0011174E7C|nr:PAS domain S-box protein [Brevibacillus dissolubilis]